MNEWSNFVVLSIFTGMSSRMRIIHNDASARHVSILDGVSAESDSTAYVLHLQTGIFYLFYLVTNVVTHWVRGRSLVNNWSNPLFRMRFGSPSFDLSAITYYIFNWFYFPREKLSLNIFIFSLNRITLFARRSFWVRDMAAVVNVAAMK